MPHERIATRPSSRRGKPSNFFLNGHQWLIVLVAVCMTTIAWALDVREVRGNPPLEWAIASLRGGAPLVAMGILMGGRVRMVGSGLAAGLAVWVGFLGALALLVEAIAALKIG